MTENYRITEPFQKPWATLHFLHGMIEDISNYEEMTAWFTRQGIRVIRQIYPWDNLSGNEYAEHIDHTWTWDKTVDDIYRIYQKENKGQPYFIAGFSLGSFLVREAIAKFDHNVFHPNGIALIGTGWQNTITAKIGHYLANKQVEQFGAFTPNVKTDSMALWNYSTKFKEQLDEGDAYNWLYKDTGIRNTFRRTYAKSFVTPWLFERLTNSMVKASQTIASMKPHNLYIMSGENDPVTGNLVKIQKKLKNKYGIRAKIFIQPEGRHAILTDKHKQETWTNLFLWITNYK